MDQSTEVTELVTMMTTESVDYVTMITDENNFLMTPPTFINQTMTNVSIMTPTPTTTTQSASVNLFCGPEFVQWFQKYLPDVPVLQIGLVICVFGIITNILNMIVFSRPKMKNSTNIILFSIALFDVIPMLTFPVYYVAKMDLLVWHEWNSEYFLFVSYLLVEFSFLSIHTSSILATSTLALWRYTAVLHPLKARSICTIKKAIYIMLAIFILSMVMPIADIVRYELVSRSDLGSVINKSYHCGRSYCVKPPSATFMRKLQYFFWVACRLIPGAILTFVSISLILALRRSSHLRRKMTHEVRATGGFVVSDSIISHSSQSTISSNFSSSSGGSIISTTTMTTSSNDPASASGDDGNDQSKKVEVNRKGGDHQGNSMSQRQQNKMDDSDRLTKMLVVVLLLFLVTEFPPAFQMVLAVFYGSRFSSQCWRVTSLVKWVTYFLSGAFNFVIFVKMSSNYRHTLKNLFVRKQ